MKAKLSSTVAVAAAIFCSAGYASAGTVTVEWKGVSPGASAFNISYKDAMGQTKTANGIAAGQMDWKQKSFTGGGNLVGNENLFSTYCIDLAQTVKSDTFTVTSNAAIVPNPSTSTGPLDTAWAGNASYTKEQALKRLFAKHFNAASTSGTFHAGFQLAVWEIVFESTLNSVGVTTGSMKVTNTPATGNVLTSINTANDFLTNLFSGGAYAEGAFRYLTAGGNQDQIYYLPPAAPGPLPLIPLPAASIAGLAIMGMIGAKRALRN